MAPDCTLSSTMAAPGEKPMSVLHKAVLGKVEKTRNSIKSQPLNTQHFNIVREMGDTGEACVLGTETRWSF